MQSKNSRCDLLKTLTHQDLLDLVEGAAIFSAGGGGDPMVGFNIVERLAEKRCQVRLIEPAEVPNDEIVVNFACVGATANVAYHSDAAIKTLRTLEEFLTKRAYAIVPSELGGFSTLAAVDMAARQGVPVVDADGAGRAVPEMHLMAYTLDNTALAPMVVADIDAQKVVLVKQAKDPVSVEAKARALAAKWNQMAYAAFGVLTGKQVKTSLLVNTLSASIRIGMLLRKTVDPLKAILRETGGFSLFEGVVSSVERETKDGFTRTDLKMDGFQDSAGSRLELKAKNEFLIAHKDGKLAAMAPDIITTVSFETGKGVPAEKTIESNKLIVLGIPAPAKWRSPDGLKLWMEVMKRSGIDEKYVPIEKLAR